MLSSADALSSAFPEILWWRPKAARDDSLGGAGISADGHGGKADVGSMTARSPHERGARQTSYEALLVCREKGA
jgi:hypothetical protein